MGPYYHPTALAAQAIAARSYAYYKIDRGLAIDNSASGNQVFLPYKFESLNPNNISPDNPGNPCLSTNLSAGQQIICAAVAPRQYMTYGAPPGDRPAFTEFTADVRGATRTHPNQATLFPYLLGVDDPISTTCDANDDGFNLAGLSSEGASRWASGNQCSFAGMGNQPWSVQWTSPLQILTHYYTGINVHDANAGNKLMTPTHRWLPLQVIWDTPDQRPPAVMNPGERRSVTFLIQNAGKESWPANANFHFSCETFAGLQSAQATQATCREQMRPSVPVPPGGAMSATLTLEIPSHTSDCFVAPFFDVYKDGTRFVELGYQEVQEVWPSFFVNIRVSGNCRVTFAPLVQAPTAVLSADEIPSH